MQEGGRNMIFPYYLRSLHDILRNDKKRFYAFSMKYHVYQLLKSSSF